MYLEYRSFFMFSVILTGMASVKDSWDTVEDWWDQYVTFQSRELIELGRTLDEMDRSWEVSDSRFDSDPLETDWSPSVKQAGPLRRGQEENWSRWLAQLIRDSSGGFTEVLFGDGFGSIPDFVHCERAFHDDILHDRRIDLLGEFGDRGITIEVKIEDEHYGKTLQAAYLTEKQYDRNLQWSHFLLLPRHKFDAVVDTFGSRFQMDDGCLSIEASGSEERPVTVLSWLDVSRALRISLLETRERDPHWSASAYLYTTLIEQQIARFYPAEFVREIQTDSATVTALSRLHSIDPEQQLQHLNGVLEVVSHG
ncbi:hypothetical protein [Halovivax gelatinilyticus]|uniref:hypothetical protein n=1 Tax=Halovivax gelatinilyticus TaxID=2961597 RepID=UPI0020CA6A54|nr:hypothetical protein [Halovivax gelatinilyticus]